MHDFWQVFGSDLGPLLGDEDDPAFWQAAIDRILGDTCAVAATPSA
jgi:hypothetical protein